MPLPVAPISGPRIAEAIQTPAQTGKSGEFQRVLDNLIKQVDQPQKEALQQVQSFLSGENEELHSVALATQKAELVFQLGLQIRNKVVEAYQEVMRMQM